MNSKTIIIAIVLALCAMAIARFNSWDEQAITETYIDGEEEEMFNEYDGEEVGVMDVTKVTGTWTVALSADARLSGFTKQNDHQYQMSWNTQATNYFAGSTAFSASYWSSGSCQSDSGADVSYKFSYGSASFIASIHIGCLNKGGGTVVRVVCFIII